MDALAKLAAFTFDFHRGNPEYIRLISIENIHHGKHLKQSEEIPKLNSQIITGLEELCRRGIEEGTFREDVDSDRTPLDDLRILRLQHLQQGNVLASLWR